MTQRQSNNKQELATIQTTNFSQVHCFILNSLPLFPLFTSVNLPLLLHSFHRFPHVMHLTNIVMGSSDDRVCFA
jgi:fumarate reductase subunit D